MSLNKKHQAVLVTETIKELAVKNGAWYLDATFGRGGHTQKILDLGAKVVAFDFDQEAIEQGQKTFLKEIEGGRLILLHENFKNINSAINNLKKSQDLEFSGILFDFGTSTDQLMSTKRGFSFIAVEKTPLDMRMDQRLGVKAGDLLLVLGEKQLAEVLFQYGGEKDAKKIAKEIHRIKRNNPESLHYVNTLVDIVSKIKGHKTGKLHPATKTFQALRIAVNDELNNIKEALPAAFQLLQNSSAKDKRLVCIAFHEGEDRLVKNFFKKQVNKNLAKLIYKKPLTASEKELTNNPRARSAKLRVLVV